MLNFKYVNISIFSILIINYGFFISIQYFVYRRKEFVIIGVLGYSYCFFFLYIYLGFIEKDKEEII